MHRDRSHERNACLSVYLSVCHSVKRANCGKAKETYANIIPQERSMNLVFPHGELLVGDAPLYLKF